MKRHPSRRYQTAALPLAFRDRSPGLGFFRKECAVRTPLGLDSLGDHHLAGGLGVALARFLFERNRVARIRGSRTVRLTDSGHKGIDKHFELTSQLAPTCKHDHLNMPW